MFEPLATPQLVDEWLRWAAWVTDPANKGRSNSDLIGHFEFETLVNDQPEKAWEAVLAIASDPRAKPYLGLLAAGPLEDILADQGALFIDRVEAEARRSAAFRQLLAGVWQSTMSQEIWLRVQACAKSA